MATVILVGLALNRPTPPPTSTGRYTGLASTPSFQMPEPISMHPGSRVLVFGDSYTAGYGAAAKTDGFAYKIASLTDWKVTVDGVGSTGYLNAGTQGQGTFEQRLEASTYSDDFDLVILQGGSNDQEVDDQDFAGAVQTVGETLQARFPRARVVVLGPVSVSTTTNENKKRIDTALRKYAYEERLPYISPVREVWFRTEDQPTLINVPVGHPNSNGYSVMAKRLVDDLQKFMQPATAAPD